MIKQILDDILKKEHRLGCYPLPMSNSLLTLTQEMAESNKVKDYTVQFSSVAQSCRTLCDHIRKT